MSYALTRAEAIQDERMSDDAYHAELALMQAYYRAEAASRDAIAKVNKLSSFATINAQAFEDFAHDELPDPESWEQTIKDEYRG